MAAMRLVCPKCDRDVGVDSRGLAYSHQLPGQTAICPASGSLLGPDLGPPPRLRKKHVPKDFSDADMRAAEAQVSSEVESFRTRITAAVPVPGDQARQIHLVDALHSLAEHVARIATGSKDGDPWAEVSRLRESHTRELASRRARERAAARPSKRKKKISPADGPSTSVRTVSGGLPGLGARH